MTSLFLFFPLRRRLLRVRSEYHDVGIVVLFAFFLFSILTCGEGLHVASVSCPFVYLCKAALTCLRSQ